MNCDDNKLFYNIVIGQYTLYILKQKPHKVIIVVRRLFEHLIESAQVLTRMKLVSYSTIII